MAVYCGVCAVRLSGGWENSGSFRVTSEFRGWHPGKISDTCDDCAAVLTKAVTVAANKLADKYRVTVDKLKAEVQEEEERRKRYDKEKDAIEAEVRRRMAGGNNAKSKCQR